MVYVVVSPGDTVVEPFTSTLPMPGSITQEPASMEDQVRAEDCPTWMLSG